jgi:hypothetical protein
MCGTDVVLHDTARQMIEKCLVASHNQGGTLVRVDYPQAFVIMPFSEKWSKKVYKKMIEPAVCEAGLECVRGDTVLRIENLTANIWGEILRAGIVVADLSSSNVNVYYELGLAHALGKDTFVLNQKGNKLPADFGGAHYYEYDRGKLKDGKRQLKKELEAWHDRRGADKVKELYERTG